MNLTTYELSESKGLYNPLGRTTFVNGELECAWSAAGIEFNAVCKGDIVIDFTVKGDIYFHIVVDGKDIENFLVNESGKYAIVSNLESGAHSVRIVKQNEMAMTSAFMKSITLNGTLEKIEPRKTHIEFIGDSITCGYRLNEISSSDATRAYAYTAAKLLNSDYAIMSHSGMGIVYSDKDNINIVIERYPLQNRTRDLDEKYVPRRVPDLVAINLGTNDDVQWGKRSATFEDVGCFNFEVFDKGFDTLINEIAEAHGTKNIPILFVMGCMLMPTRTKITDRIKYLITLDKYKDFSFKVATLTMDRSGVNCHPSVEGGKQQGTELAEFISREYKDIFVG